MAGDGSEPVREDRPPALEYREMTGVDHRLEFISLADIQEAADEGWEVVLAERNTNVLVPGHKGGVLFSFVLLKRLKPPPEPESSPGSSAA
jgi:hypothetical protein